MLLSLITRLCTILPSLIAALPQDTDPTSNTSTSLPDTLQRTVPACAQPCLWEALNNQFPLACTVQIDLSCLCSRYSINGESLGEVALGCIYASCPTIDSRAASAYNVCLGQKGAVLPTQTALTVVAGSSINSKAMASSQSVVITKHTSALASSSRVQPTPTNTVIADSISFTPSATSSPSLSTPKATSTPVAQGPQTMKPAQIAGLSIAAAATFIVAIGLMALSIFVRKRRERKKVMEITEKKTQGSPPRAHSIRYSQAFPGSSLSRKPPVQFPLPPKSRPSPKAVSNKTPYTNSHLKRISPNTTVYTVQSNASPNEGSIHPLRRPNAGFSRNSSNSSVPLDQIGLAISAELPGKSVTPAQTPQPPRKAELRQHRSKSLRRSLQTTQRPDSVLTQNTVFEEDVVPDRHRESTLLPTPPIPIPPIRSFQPSRPPPAFNLPVAVKPQRVNVNRQVAQQPELFLNIPVRHSRSQPTRITPAEAPFRSSPAPTAQLAPPIQLSSAYDQYKPASTHASTTETSNSEDIPDYYFTAHQDPAMFLPPRASPGRLVAKESPKVVNIKPKPSSSTISRATSRASTNIRESISSQTSFETVDTNDPTPEDEDDEKQLSSDDNKLSPVAESPISNLRYPKVPRASNQLVPRSPRSPQSQRSLGSPRGLPEPSALLVKRRGEREALQLESRLQMGSPNRAEVRNHMKNYRQHIRSNSVKAFDTGTASERTTRTQSGQWPKSPAMYETDIVRPLNIRSRQLQYPPQQQPPDMKALKSPAWVPRLTPTRHGDDLLISVTYSKPGH